MIKKQIRFSAFCLLIVMYPVLHAQQGGLSRVQLKIDSLTRLLRSSSGDTAKITLYARLGDLCAIEDNMKYTMPALVLIDQVLAKTSDSLTRSRLHNQKAFMYTLCRAYYDSGKDKQLSKATQLSKILDYFRMELEEYKLSGNRSSVTATYISLADYYNDRGEVMKKLQTLNEGLKYAIQTRFKRGMSRYYVQLAFLFADEGDTLQALDAYRKAGEMEKLIADTTRISRGYELRGSFFVRMKQFDAALENYFTAIKRYGTANDSVPIPELYMQVGNTFLEKHELEKALNYYQMAYDMAKRRGMIAELFRSMNDLGATYDYMRKPDKAIQFHEEALKIARQSEVGFAIAASLRYLAQDYFHKKEYARAMHYSDEALANIRERTVIQEIMQAEELAYKIDSAAGKSGEAFGHYLQYIRCRDKVNDAEMKKASIRNRFQAEYEKQTLADKSEQEKKDVQTRAENRKQRLIAGFSIVGLLLMLVVAVVILRSLRQTRKQKLLIEQKEQETRRQKLLIEEKNREITDSISYAKRIQHSILPPLEEISAALPASFVLFKPKDIVSGDFYWFHDTRDVILIAAADCTGHGVPGAFMSMLNSDKLNEALKQSTDVSEILQLVNNGLKKALRQSDKEDSTRDGMDIALCGLRMTAAGALLDYAGANRPLWMIRKEGTEIIEIKATKTAIGGLTADHQEFTKHSFELNKGDTFYIFTDGYADQFSSADKKLMTRKLKEILISITSKNMEEQRQYLDSFIESWKNGMEQTDDMLVIGVRI